jgi:regulation of enolase protein 1 (concanavalin A-like superfamily)
MKRSFHVLLSTALAAGSCAGGEIVFQDDFNGKLADGWSWVREHREAWRATARGLEVRIEPGNMWGPANDAKNVLVRPAPEPGDGELEVSVTVETHPTNQYEQADLVWYYDDSNMVKLGRELVDGKLSIVMGREQGDKTRTLALIPIQAEFVRLKLLVKGNQIRGQYLLAGTEEWRDASHCDLPAPPGANPKLSLQFYQGPADSAHWARVTEFRVRRVGK